MGLHRPRLHKLGGASWKRTRDKARTAIREMAAELLELYANRANVTPGYGLPARHPLAA